MSTLPKPQSNKPLHSSSPSSNFTLHTLTSASTSLPSALIPILALSNEIFNTASRPVTHHSSLGEWLRRLSNPASILVYATATSTPESPPASPARDLKPELPLAATLGTNSNPIGFLFAHPKPLLVNGTADGAPPQTLHIWLTGVKTSYRGHGLFSALMDPVEAHALRHSIETLSVATFPGRFERMYALLRRGGWVEIEAEGRESEKGWSGGKVVLTKAVGIAGQESGKRMKGNTEEKEGGG